MNRTNLAALAALSALLYPGQPPFAETVEDHLVERWYELELIVFERLPVLDATTAEQLTSTRPRQWPNNLLELDLPLLLEQQRQEQALAATTTFFGDADPSVCFEFDESVELQLPVEEEQSIEEVIDELEQEQLDAQADEAIAPGALPLPPPPTPYELALAAIAAFELELYAQAYRPRELTMTGDVKALNRRRDLRPLIHQRWLQPVPPRESPLPVYISADITPQAPATLDGFAKVEGFVELTVSRYLHFAPTLWYHADNLGLDPQPFPPSASDALDAPRPVGVNVPYMELQESRRMRSTDLHYLDHPKLGIIVRVDPVEVPPELERDLQSALQKSR